MMNENLQRLIRKRDELGDYWICPYCLCLITLSQLDGIPTYCETCGAEWRAFDMVPITSGGDQTSGKAKT